MRTAQILPLPAAVAAATRAAALGVLDQAAAWAAFARARTTQQSVTLFQKAIESARFTTEERARAFAVPSKLAGTKAHAEHVQALAVSEPPRFLPLVVTEQAGALVVSFEDAGGRLRPLGHVQPKHAGWAAPLLAHGVRLYLLAVTGLDREGATLGVNVAFGHVGPAVLAATAAPSGDGAATPPSPVACEPAAPYGAATAAEQAHAVRLYRGPSGAGRARFEPAGFELGPVDEIEWGYAGWGPARLARLVLAYFEGAAVADWLGADFKGEVIAVVPREGVTLTAQDVRGWVERTTRAAA